MDGLAHEAARDATAGARFEAELNGIEEAEAKRAAVPGEVVHEVIFDAGGGVHQKLSTRSTPFRLRNELWRPGKQGTERWRAGQDVAQTFDIRLRFENPNPQGAVMKRPLALLTSAALAGLALVVPFSATAAHAEDGDLDISAVSAAWKDSTLTVRYSWDSYTADSTIDVLVDGTSIDHTTASEYGEDDVVATTTRARAAGAPAISIVANVCTYTDGFLSTTCTDVTEWTGSATRVLTPPHGRSSALALLDKLKVKAESHAGSYKRSKFKLWVDANGNHENTRAEVLKSESKKRASLNSRHTVTTGKWVSPYDGRTVTVASKLDIDHLVPLEEAWTSGASSWSAKKREAYANDLGYGPSLVAVTKHANRSKGDKEPNAYLPALSSYRCSYVRNWIAVKSRWGLAVNTAEKSALTADLTTYCTSNDWVSTPGKPKISALVPRPAPTQTGGSGSTGSSGGSSGGQSGGGSLTSAPSGATAICRDGSYSYSQHRQGTCSHHGGVSVWL